MHKHKLSILLTLLLQMVMLAQIFDVVNIHYIFKDGTNVSFEQTSNCSTDDLVIITTWGNRWSTKG